MTCIGADDDVNVQISGPAVFEQYIVIADYKKKNANDISLTAGDTIDVIERNDVGKKNTDVIYTWHIQGSQIGENALI